MSVWEWVVKFVSGLFTGKEPIVWAAAGLAFLTDNVIPVLEGAASASDSWELIGIAFAAFAARSQYTPVANR